MCHARPFPAPSLPPPPSKDQWGGGSRLVVSQHTSQHIFGSVTASWYVLMLGTSQGFYSMWKNLTISSFVSYEFHHLCQQYPEIAGKCSICDTFRRACNEMSPTWACLFTGCIIHGCVWLCEKSSHHMLCLRWGVSWGRMPKHLQYASWQWQTDNN